MAKNQRETLINEGDVSAIVENGKDSAIVNDQFTSAEPNKDR